MTFKAPCRALKMSHTCAEEHVRGSALVSTPRAVACRVHLRDNIFMLIRKGRGAALAPPLAPGDSWWRQNCLRTRRQQFRNV